MADGQTHIAGLDLTWDGRFQRQRCAWCGVTLLDYDLSMIQVMVEEDGTAKAPGFWAVGALVHTEDGVSQVIEAEYHELAEGDTTPAVKVPDDCCMRLDPEVTA